MTAGTTQSITIYLSYAQEDEALKQEFEDYLAILQQGRLISDWFERQVQRGTDWSQIIDARLFTANLVLLLISPRLLGSGYCSGAEMHETFKRRDKGDVILIPIILHPVNLEGSPIDKLQSLPRNHIPVSSWPERKYAWLDIDWGIRQVIRQFHMRQYYTRP